MIIFSSLRQFMRIYQSPVVLILHFIIIISVILQIVISNWMSVSVTGVIPASGYRLFLPDAYYYRSFILGFRYPAYCSLLSSAGNKALLPVGFRLFFADSN